MGITTGRSNRAVEPISAEIIGQAMLPEDPQMLYKFSENPIVSPDQKRSLLKRAANILDELEFRRTDEQNKLLGDIRSRQGELEKAVQAYGDYLLIFHDDTQYLNKRAKLYEQLGKYNLALKDVNRLIDLSKKDPTSFRKRARELRIKLLEQKESGR